MTEVTWETVNSRSVHIYTCFIMVQETTATEETSIERNDNSTRNSFVRAATITAGVNPPLDWDETPDSSRGRIRDKERNCEY